MSKRVLSLISLLLLLTMVGVTQAQDNGSASQLLADQLKTGFHIPSSATRQISNVSVDMKNDGVHVSFQMTVVRDGTSNTMNIIAILIGLVGKPQVSSFEMENTLISSYSVGSGLRSEAMSLLLSSWNDFVATGLPAGVDTSQSLIMKDGNICDPIRHIGC
ncbi:MAG: hypothetical protein GC204_09720 [Chloroflexi bacterium]|nr:hypothetical protein [Chloroflexota bacterium]